MKKTEKLKTYRVDIQFTTEFSYNVEALSAEGPARKLADSTSPVKIPISIAKCSTRRSPTWRPSMAKKLKKVNGWPNPNGLSKAQLVDVIMNIQGILWGDDNGDPDPDREWEVDTIENVADAMIRKGLCP